MVIVVRQVKFDSDFSRKVLPIAGYPTKWINGGVYYVQFEKVKALYLVHMKVIVE